MPLRNRSIIKTSVKFHPSRIPGLLALYYFTEGSGTTVIDRSGNGRHGTITGTPNWTRGGLSLGTASNLTIPVAYPNTNSISVCFDPTICTGTPTLWDEATASSSALNLIGKYASGHLQPRLFKATSVTTADINTPSFPTTVGWSNPTRLFVGGKEPTIYDSTSAVSLVRNGTSMKLGSTFQGTVSSVSPVMYGAALYSTTLTPDDHKKLNEWFNNKGRYAAQRRTPNLNGSASIARAGIFTIGNSVTNNMTDAMFASYIAYPHDRLNASIPGGDETAISAKANQSTIPMFRPLTPYNIATMWMTPNGIDATSIYNATRAMGTTLRNRGFKVVMIGPGSHNNGFDAIKTALQAYYTSPTTGWNGSLGAYADAFVDLSNYPNIYNDGAYLSSTYYLDQLHFAPISYTSYILPDLASKIIQFLPPQARFNVSATMIEPGGTVTCTDTSQGTVTSYSWSAVGRNQGQTLTSTAANPTFTLTTPDIYRITLTVVGPNGTTTASSVVSNDGSASVIGITNSPIYSWTKLHPDFCYQDTTSLVPATQDAGIATAPDRTANGKGLTQTTSNLRPTLGTSSGRWYGVGVAANNTVLNYAASAFSTLTGSSIYMVVRSTVLTANNGIAVFGSGAADTYPGNPSGNFDNGWGSSVRKGSIVSGTTLNTWHILAVHSAANDFRVDIDGVNVRNTATNTVGWSTTPKIFANIANSGSLEIAEVIVTNGITNPTDDGIIRAYLKASNNTP